MTTKDGKLRILMVDDSELILTRASAGLTQAGFDVTTTTQTVGASRYLSNVDLVILDSVMPRLSGRETLRELVQLKPDIRVLFSSGFSTEPLSPTEYPQVLGFLPKPYRMEQLLQKVHEILRAT